MKISNCISAFIKQWQEETISRKRIKLKVKEILNIVDRKIHKSRFCKCGEWSYYANGNCMNCD